MSASFVYSKSVHKVFIALFVEYPLCFLLCHNLRLHMLKTCGIGKQFFLFYVLDLNPIFGNQDPPPTFRPRNICPCLSRSIQYLNCAHFLLVGRRSERLCRRLVIIHLRENFSRCSCVHKYEISGVRPNCSFSIRRRLMHWKISIFLSNTK